MTGDLISLYRDDLTELDRYPTLQSTNIEGDVTGMDVVLVDDVIFTAVLHEAYGRTHRFGQTKTIQLAVMVDRGHRELPIRPDYVGKNIPTAKSEIVLVRVKEIDGQDGVYIGVKQ